VNFDLSEEQQVISDLAAKLFGDLATTGRVKAIEAAEGFDRDLWRELADAGLLAVPLPERAGGSGMGMVALNLIATQQGRTVAPVPLVPSVVTALALAQFAGDRGASLVAGAAAGEIVLTSALAETGSNSVADPSVVATAIEGGYRLTGWKPAVPYAQLAAHIVVPASADGIVGLFLVDTAMEGVTVEPVATTDRQPAGHVTFDVEVGAADRIGDAAALTWLIERMLVARSAVQVGVCEGSLAATAEHVATREQFGRPLATFQAVSQRAADSYITTEALRLTTLQAAWLLDEGLDGSDEALVAAWWAAEGGHQVVLAGQHLHGGIGADIDYPVHRYFLWGSQLGTSLGSGSAHLSNLGRRIAGAPDEGSR
jgi:alkylation response protein AidB-like acyl-CoA dehydrogenase